MQILVGERIGREATLRLGCAAVVWDGARAKLLLTRRTDNGQWCLPGGGMDPGESAAECVERELWEETGLRGCVVRLLGVYSNPHQLVAYADGNRYQLVALTFEVEVTGGTLGLSNETTAFGYFAPAELETMDLLPIHRERIADALAGREAAVVR